MSTTFIRNAGLQSWDTGLPVCSEDLAAERSYGEQVCRAFAGLTWQQAAAKLSAAWDLDFTRPWQTQHDALVASLEDHTDPKVKAGAAVLREVAHNCQFAPAARDEAAKLLALPQAHFAIALDILGTWERDLAAVEGRLGHPLNVDHPLAEDVERIRAAVSVGLVRWGKTEPVPVEVTEPRRPQGLASDAAVMSFVFGQSNRARVAANEALGEAAGLVRSALGLLDSYRQPLLSAERRLGRSLDVERPSDGDLDRLRAILEHGVRWAKPVAEEPKGKPGLLRKVLGGR
jgi:hypothetical protein